MIKISINKDEITIKGHSGYSEEGSKGTTTVTFGTIPHVDYVAGNAFDCDMNGDGVFDDDGWPLDYINTFRSWQAMMEEGPDENPECEGICSGDDFWGDFNCDNPF